MRNQRVKYKSRAHVDFWQFVFSIKKTFDFSALALASDFLHREL